MNGNATKSELSRSPGVEAVSSHTSIAAITTVKPHDIYDLHKAF